MDKARNQLQKAFEQIVSGNFIAVLRQLKKIKESLPGNAPADLCATLCLYEAFTRAKLFQFGSATAESKSYCNQMAKLSQAAVFENSRMISSVYYIVCDLASLRLLFDGLESKGDPFDAKFAKMVLETKLVNCDWNAASTSALKVSKVAKKSANYQLSSFVFKLFSLFEGQLWKANSYSDYPLFDLELSQETVKKAEFALKLVKQTIAKFESLNSESLKRFVQTIDVFVSLKSGNSAETVKKLSELPVDYELFCLLRKIVTVSDNDLLKRDLVSLYEIQFTSFFKLKSQSEIESKQPMIDEIKFVATQLKSDNPTFRFSEEFKATVYGIFAENEVVCEDNQRGVFHLRESLLAQAMFSATKEEFDVAIEKLVSRFGEQPNFVPETISAVKGTEQLLEKLIASQAIKSSSFRLSLYKLQSSVSWTDCLKEYVSAFDSSLVLAKGERRKEDDWLLLCLERLRQEGQSRTTLLLTNYLSMVGYSASRYNFDILLHFVDTNNQLGAYARNAELFTENDLKGSQNETLAFSFNSAYWECGLIDKVSGEVLTRYFRNSEEVTRRASKSIIHAIKSANFNFIWEMFWNLEMNVGSYQRAIVYLNLEGKSLLGALKGNKESLNDFRFFSQKLDNLEDFSYFNADFVSHYGYGVFNSPSFTKLMHQLNSLVFNIGFNSDASKVKESISKVRAELEAVKQESLVSFKQFFKVIRKSLTKQQIDDRMKSVFEGWTKIAKSPQFVEFLDFVNFVVESLSSPTNFEETSQSHLNINCRLNLFVVSNKIALTQKTLLALKIKTGSCPVQLNVIEQFEAIHKRLIDGIHFEDEFDDFKNDLVSGLKSRLSIDSFRSHLKDSFPNFKYMVEHELKTVKPAVNQ